ncbi:MAG: hypothetical protein OEX77_06300 [Candidatus Bathyarchaeota archaeon]|nr:hypothetical protein [Candidatus Bathyarchaeota archaeon]MDH5732960.1 hypothetical protein [Candidatus Bathyarchaeota archaeon]
MSETESNQNQSNVPFVILFLLEVTLINMSACTVLTDKEVFLIQVKNQPQFFMDLYEAGKLFEPVSWCLRDTYSNYNIYHNL